MMSGLGNQDQIFRMAGDTTAEAYNEIWLQNARQNLVTRKRHSRLQDVSTDRTKVALVCGSGKSLDLHIDLIRRHRDKLCLLAVDMAYPALLSHEVEPDFTVNMDPKEVLKSCFDGMPDATNCSLIAATVSHPALLANWKGKVHFYNLYDRNTPALKKVANMFPGIANVDSKFNVGELCLCLATTTFHFPHVGFTGIDLGYWQNEYYATGARASFVPDPSELLVLWNSDNQPTVTTRRFAIYMQAFMDNCERTYARVASVYNLSKGIIPLKYRRADFDALLRH